MIEQRGKMETLRRLDKDAERPGTIVALAVGITGTLIMGFGMCCTMVWTEQLFVVGVIVGIIGMTIAGVAYPMYKKVTKNQREKVAAQILALSSELAM